MKSILFCLILTTISCASQKNQTQSIQTFEMPYELITYSKTPCFGKCPVYKMHIYSDGMAILEGEQNMNHIGTYHYQLTDDELNTLIALIDQTDFSKMEDRYYGNVSDLPSTGLKVKRPNFEKEIGGNMGFPEDLLTVFTELNGYAHSERWAPVKRDMELYLYHDSVIPDRIIVNLKDGIEGESWIKKFADVDGAIVKRVTPRMKIWLISYDMKLIHPSEMIERVKANSAVINAEFDKKAEMRGRGRG